MPAPLDLLGRQFGRLRVIARGPKVQFGTLVQGWVCRCVCGTELVVPQTRLPHADWIVRLRGRVVDSCPACRGTPCAVCGTPVPLSGAGHGRRATCSAGCADEHRKAKQRASWHRRCARDPELARRMHARRLARAAADPEFAAKVIAWERGREERRQQRRAADPEYAARLREQARTTYARHAARIQAERRARLDSLSPAEREAWAERARAYTRTWHRKFRVGLRNDPTEHERYRQIQGEYRRVFRERREQPPPERACVICGTVFASRKYRVLCDDPKCKAVYGRDKSAQARARLAENAFRRIETELNEVLRNADRSDSGRES